MIFYLLLTLFAYQSARLLHRGQLVTTLGINLSNGSYDSGSESAPFMLTAADPISALNGIEDGAGNDVTDLIIDRGSTSDGVYVRFGDGTMICVNTASPSGINVDNSSSTSTGWYRSGLQQYPFPQSPAVVYSSLVTGRSMDPINLVINDQTKDTEWYFYFALPESTTIDVRLNMIMVGTWK